MISPVHILISCSSQMPLSPSNPFYLNCWPPFLFSPPPSSLPTPNVSLISHPTISPSPLEQLLFLFLFPPAHQATLLSPWSAPNLPQMLSISLLLPHHYQCILSQISFTNFFPDLTTHPSRENGSLILCFPSVNADFFKAVALGV